MQQIEIHTGMNAVSRIVGAGSLADVAGLLAHEAEVYLVYDRNVAWVADTVEALMTSGAAEAGPAAGGAAEMPILRGRRALDATEEGKDMAAVMDICRWLLDLGATRNALLVAIGGGITTDLAGFAASIYKRGIRYANIPTTLLAQVDAGIGGKTGVNFLEFKNMLGVIVQPVFTFICARTLRTLPQRDFRSGIAELLKTFLIEDRDDGYARAVRLFSSPERGGNGDEPGMAAGSCRIMAENGHEPRYNGFSCRNMAEIGHEPARELQELVFAAAAVKAGVVGRDPYEHGERRRLNLGHTFAHAIEHNARLSGDDITHGEAVAMGIILAARLAARLEGNVLAVQRGLIGILDRPVCPDAPDGMESRLRADFSAAGLPVDCPYPLAALAEAMEKDKKAGGGRVRFQIPVAIGRVGEADLTVSEAMDLLGGAGRAAGDGADMNDGNK